MKAPPYLTELRIRIEHAQLIAPEDFKRLKRLGILIAAQPSALNNPEKDIALLGKERAGHAYPYKSFLQHGIPLSFGSDVPGEDIADPLVVIHNAVNRSGPEAVSIDEALKAYTSGSAYAEFLEEAKGTLEPGKLADFIVLSRSPYEVAPDSIKDIRVEQTYVGGKRLL